MRYGVFVLLCAYRNRFTTNKDRDNDCYYDFNDFFTIKFNVLFIEFIISLKKK